MNMQGAFQQVNGNTALLAWEKFCKKFSIAYNKEKTLLGIEKAFIAGRLQFIPQTENMPSFLLDAGHNLQGLEAVENYILYKQI